MYLRFVTTKSRFGVLSASAIALIALIAVCAWSSTAQAKTKTWKPSSNKIVIGRSIGGVKIGADYKSAAKAWGGLREGSKGFVKTKIQSTENPKWRAYYLLPSITSLYAQDARFGVSNNKANPAGWKNSRVFTIRLISPKGMTGGPLNKLKTSRGIGIGSTIDELKAAYPDVITDDSQGQAWDAANPTCAGLPSCVTATTTRPKPTYYFLTAADKTWRITAFKTLDDSDTIQQIFMSVTGPIGK
ncbi:MAG: hypothetical protein QM648_06655 [Solirubrobacterales bacterium]